MTPLEKKPLTKLELQIFDGMASLKGVGRYLSKEEAEDLSRIAAKIALELAREAYHEGWSRGWDWGKEGKDTGTFKQFIEDYI